jgi:hypothetical protein
MTSRRQRIPTDADPQLYKAEQGGAFAPIATTIANGMLSADITGLSWVIPGYASTRPRVVYAVTGSTRISSFRIARGTGLASAATSTMATGQVPISVIVHPSRRFLLVTCTNVRMSSNESCHLELTVKSPQSGDGRRAYGSRL